MTMHYHGTPITPLSVLHQLTGRNFCVSFARPEQIEHVHRIGQSIMLDNGAFSLWRKASSNGNRPLSARLRRCAEGDWTPYFEWCRTWLAHPCTWAVIPDVIDGTEAENDLLLATWHNQRLPRGAPVWHLHESFERLKRLCIGYDRVCLGSSGAYARIGSPSWHARMRDTMDALYEHGHIDTQLHMLRGMALVGGPYPFASVDSTDIGRNHNRGVPPDEMAKRWDSQQCPPTWTGASQLTLT